MTEAFLYCWTDHKTNKLYVGSHKGRTNDGYICSSKIMMKEYIQRPNDFTRQIIAEGNFSDIRNLEVVILKSVDAKKSEDFYNMHNGDGNFYLKEHTENSKAKISNSKKGFKHSAESRKKMSNSRIGIEPWNKNKKGLQKSKFAGIERSDEVKAKISEKLKGKTPWNKNIPSENSSFYGKTHSEEAKNRMSDARKLYWQNKKKSI